MTSKTFSKRICQAFQKANELMQMEAKPADSKSNKKKSLLMIVLMSSASLKR